jgi:hypothetical protein
VLPVIDKLNVKIEILLFQHLDNRL